MPDSSETPPPADSRHAVEHGPRFTLGGIVLGGFAIVIIVALLLPMTRGGAREAARRNSCLNNLKQIALGILNYETANGTLPPAYTVDAEGRRLHSWRTLILPYMEHATLYKTIDLSKPWDDPANAQARASERITSVYSCPSTSLAEGLTTYLAVVGTRGAFTGSAPRETAEVKRNRSDVLTVIDAPSDRAVHWMSPNDISTDDFLTFGPETKTNHVSVLFLAAFLDGHTGSISMDLNADILRSTVTIDGEESTGE